MITNSNFLFDKAKFEGNYEIDFIVSQYFAFDENSIFLIHASDSTRARQIRWVCDDETEARFFFRDLQASTPLPIVTNPGEMLEEEEPKWIEMKDWIPFVLDEDLKELFNQIFDVIEQKELS